MASGATWEAIDTISSLGYSACAKTVEEFRKKIQKKHVIKIEEHFVNHKNLFHVYNIDNYHSIHENRRPDITSTSTAKHFATCVAKLVFECPSVLLIFNGVSIHNSANIESPRICWYLLKRYTEVFDISYTDNIIERKEERSMNGLKLLARNEWIKIKSKIIEKFGQTCKDIEYRMMIDLLDNLIPSTLDIYATLFRSGQFDAYVETKHLASFNEYYVENTHSRIWANTSHNATTDNIIKQAYVIMNLEPTFKDTYKVFYNRGISVPITTEEIDKKITEKIINKPIKTNTKKTATTTTKKNYYYHHQKATKKFKSEVGPIKKKGADTLISEDLDDDENNIEEDIEEQPEVEGHKTFRLIWQFKLSR
ncbi:hypothetical protein C2G38_2174112 [Gigaspora rosea]|uniref:Uncharacterized protein n=1 Tax=Gigaspora rosea TaxID=44941 RepID=A0A397VN04_9GLOM|nr:hypothetical protein C2G38_2174112 [Gigaspora rosea]